MKWVGHPENDSILSLVDDSQTAILGQAIREQSGGWIAHDYCANGGAGKRLGRFSTAQAAQDAIAISVERMKV